MDYHTVSSRLLPDGTYDTKRTEIGELVYQAKYRADRNKIQPIAKIAAKFVKEEFTVNGYPILPYVDAVIPTPPSDTTREFQPVTEIAAEIGRILGKSVILDYLFRVKEIIPVKNLEEEENRQEQLKDAYKVRFTSSEYRCVLLFDDIYRSGETVSEATNTLRRQGGISRVLVLTLTQTRTKK